MSFLKEGKGYCNILNMAETVGGLFRLSTPSKGAYTGIFTRPLLRLVVGKVYFV